MIVPKERRRNIDARSVCWWFLDYSEHQKAYRFEDLRSGRGRGRVVVSRDAQFMEDMFDSGRCDRRRNEIAHEND